MNRILDHLRHTAAEYRELIEDYADICREVPIRVQRAEAFQRIAGLIGEIERELDELRRSSGQKDPPIDPQR